MSSTTKDVTIQDYILNSIPAKSPTVKYEVVAQNNTDFIVRRTTLKTQRELVILISQGIFYLKDTKQQSIEPVTLALLKSFLRYLKDDLPLNQVLWMPILNNESADYIDRIISNDILVDMCRHNVIAGLENPERYIVYWQQNKKLFERVVSLFPTITDAGENKYKNSIPVIFELDKRYGYNEAIYLAERITKTGLTNCTFTGSYHPANLNATGFISLLENPTFNLNLRRFIDYILFDLYGQGYADIYTGFWNEYKDYLMMQLQFYGKIKEKYPEHFKTEHDIMTLKINQVKAIQECKNFEARAKEIEDLAYKKGDYCIVIPTHPEDLAEEGVSLNHCVKGYISRVAEGECHILFLRKAKTPERSLVTLQLSGNCIVQAQGYNRRSITPQERQFLIKWAAEKNIMLHA